MLVRNYKYRIYPTRQQASALNHQMCLCKALYNMLLMLCRDQYKANGEHPGRTELNLALRRIKEYDPKFYAVHSQVLQNVSDRITKAYNNFFKRLKMRQDGRKVKAGFPRFKKFVSGIIYPQSGFELLGDRTLYVSKVGNVKIRLHRSLEGTVKTMAVTKTPSGKWFVTFSCELDIEPIPTTNQEGVGIDVGLEVFAALSDNFVVENPRNLRKAEKRLERIQRRMSRRVRGGKNYKRAQRAFQVQHERVANRRCDFHHKLSRWLVNNYGVIAVEDLNVKEMVEEGFLSKSILDAGWGGFLRMTEHKAESAGARFVRTPAQYTSQECSGCGKMVWKPLSEQVHRCDACGLVLNRHVNSSRVTLARAGHARSYAWGDLTPTVWTYQMASRVAEPGTGLRETKGNIFENRAPLVPSGSP